MSSVTWPYIRWSRIWISPEQERKERERGQRQVLSHLVWCDEEGYPYRDEDKFQPPSPQPERSESGAYNTAEEIGHNMNEDETSHDTDNEIRNDTSHNTDDDTDDETSDDTSDASSDDSNDHSGNETSDEITDEIDKQANRRTAEETDLEKTSLKKTPLQQDSDLEITDQYRRFTNLSIEQEISSGYNTIASSGSEPRQTKSAMPEESNCHDCTRFDSWDTMIACSKSHNEVERWFHLRCAGVSPYAMPQDDEAWFCRDCKVQSEEESRSKSKEKSEHHNDTGRLNNKDDAHRVAGTHYDNGHDQAQGDGANFNEDNDSRDVVAQDDLNNKHKNDQEVDEKTEAKDVESDAGYSPGKDYYCNKRKSRRSAPIPKRKPQKQATYKPKPAAGTAKQPAALTSIKKKSEPWTQREKDLVAVLMQQVIDEQQVNLVEKRWNVISERLNGLYDIARSSTAVKNYWNREGRQHTGIDERRKPNPDKMITGVQNPADRRRARQEAAKMAGGRRGEEKEKRDEVEEEDEGEDEDDDDDDDDDDEEDRPRIKRRKRN